MSDPRPITFEEWLQTGMQNGWIGPPVCFTHDGIPSSASEDEEFESGYDPCQYGLRLYDDEQHMLEIQENHSPTNWRESNSRNTSF